MSNRGPTAVFAPALAEMTRSGKRVFGPQPFQAYVEEHGLRAPHTAARISIQDWAHLPMDLKRMNTMVLRLGGLTGRTEFALVRVDDLSHLFLDVSRIDKPEEQFTSVARAQDLFAYGLIKPSETTLVNLAFASGLISSALRLDEAGPLPAPAKGVLRETFSFRVGSGVEREFKHQNGPVEVDAIFVAERAGQRICFVLEAKQSKHRLANHKLVYPVLALARHLSRDVPIVPVYLGVVPKPDTAEYRFTVAECTIPDPRTTGCALDELRARDVRVLTVGLGGADA